MEPTTTLPATQNRLSGPTKGGKLARKRSFQRGSFFQRGKRNKVWVARWWEETIDGEGKPIRVRRSENPFVVESMMDQSNVERFHSTIVIVVELKLHRHTPLGSLHRFASLSISLIHSAHISEHHGAEGIPGKSC